MQKIDKQLALKSIFIPELGMPRRGKVRDIYEHEGYLTLVASDRISAFDRILPDPLQDKGMILTKLSMFWFEQTHDIVQNHIVSHPDPNVLIVKKCQPIMAEVIVRGYLAGSLWRDYQSGKRKKCGIPLADGLKQHDPLPEIIVTPTTKNPNGHDEDISKEELIQSGIVSRELWEQIEAAAKRLYLRGQEILRTKGLTLVDTKYEFGLDENQRLILIDEIHTPDSSRFWFQQDYERKEVKFPDKEFLREWLRKNGFAGEGPLPAIPHEIKEKVREGYRSVYETITGRPLNAIPMPVSKRIVGNLKQHQIIKGVFALIIAGSEKDQAHIDRITAVLKDHHIPYNSVIASAHKHPHQVLNLIEQYNESIEPLVCLTVAGRSNALSGVVASNLRWPVIACPPFKDYADYLTNIHSSLQMPSNVPVLTVIDPENAALATLRILKTMEQT